MNVVLVSLASEQNPQQGTDNNVMSAYNKQSTVDSGDNSNLPDFVRDIAKPRSDVVAWTRLDPALDAELGKFVCFRTFGPGKPLLFVV